jgi:deazaflavin-dependent oxidoreductase (nitroreductase family)
MTAWDEEDFCYVTTRGRRTGSPHTIEIWFGAETASTIYLLSGGGDRSDWVRNLMADPSVHVRIDDQEWDARANALARRLLASKYQGWREGKRMSGWATGSLPVAIDLA